MARVLIAYATVEGHTAKVAEAMRTALAEAGHDARLVQIHGGHDALPDDIDAVILGGPIHAGHHKKELVAFAKAHRRRLAALAGGFFTVCLTAAEDSDEARAATEAYVQAFCDAAGWAPRHTAVFAGCLAWTQYDFFTRLIMRLMTRQKGVTDRDVKRDYDYTDYAAVRRFAVDVARSVEPATVG